jgi:hypothetical protein
MAVCGMVGVGKVPNEEARMTEPQHSEADSQHTRGPWHRCEAQPDAIVGPRCEPGTCRSCDELERGWDVGEPVDRKTYGDYYGGHFICESVSSRANFNLITASPDLAAAARLALPLLAAYRELNHRNDGCGKQVAAADALEAALAKVAGTDAQ